MAEPRAQSKRMFDGPIPGENYTSDTKNYPWHRPPEYTDLNEAIEAATKQLTSEEGSVGLLTMIESGFPIVSLAQTFIMSGVGAGKWTIDYGLLMAGPVAKIMCLMAKGYGIDYEMGLDSPMSGIPSRKYYEALSELEDEEGAEQAGRDVAEAMGTPQESSAAPGGFMGGPQGIEQLGQEAPDPAIPVDDEPVTTQEV